MEKLGPQILRARFEAQQPALIEGGWISPDEWGAMATQHSGVKCYAVFMGYPLASSAQIRDRLSGTEHWLGQQNPEQIDKIEEQIAYSAYLRSRVHNSPSCCFIDTSAAFYAWSPWSLGRDYSPA
jgi:hypothetical protein